MLQKLPLEKQAHLTSLLEVHEGNIHRSTIAKALSAYKQSNSNSPKPQFRYHKNLSTSRYDEFLAESDDEEFF